ncbi:MULTISPECIES: LysR family transcriptional regulator [Pacificibacter]|uniref:LysR family transcriptional regulator n=1 Tax=Pacificibacter TaxID=1042323 RepID=UPI001C09730C|nr:MULTISPECIES: LysR family transcriptional regulator [Pacificibacter]MBU2936568.1 LysR family transcriptional regulator [Pacificibacter marinus]MDO6614630.1 LysR family transcriptional regulator [Pacificibacter sp. 1_MG-2023]
MDTQTLRLFVLACETLNISAAGRALGMAPAVASTRIAKLEHLVGADLLHRSTRKVSLSLEGRDFLPYAREMIALEETALAALGTGRTTISGTLRFAAPSTFAQLYIAPLLPKFMDKYPDLRLDLHLSDSEFDLIEGSYDLALRNSALADSSLTARKLADDTRILCASPAYLERYGTPNTAEGLTKHRLIAFKNNEARSLASHDGTQMQFDPKAAAHYLTVNDGLTQKLTTLDGGGISINSLWAVQKEIAEGTLVRVLPDYELANKPALWLIYPKSNVVSAKVRVFMDFLIEHFGRQNVSRKTS